MNLSDSSKRYFLITVLVLSGLSQVVVAHHPVAPQYELDREYTIAGVLSRVELGSPHSFLHVDVTDEDGQLATVRVEWGSASSLNRLYSISRSGIQLSQKIRVRGFLSKNRDELMMWPMSIHTEFDLEYDRATCNLIEKEGKRCVVLTESPPLWPVELDDRLEIRD
jgi:hypothetical protein